MTTNNTLYAALGVEASATAEEIETAFIIRQQALHGSPDELSLLRVAYATLRHPEQRAAYDRKCKRQQLLLDAIATEPETRPRSTSRLILLLAASGAIAFFWLSKPAPKPNTPVADKPLAMVEAAPAAALKATSEGSADPSAQQQEPAAGSSSAPLPAVGTATATSTSILPTRGTKQAGFDPQYIAWSVFTIRQRNLTGSGVMIGPDRILTNCHVLAGGATNGLVVVHGMTKAVTRVEKYARLDGEDACLLLAPGAGNDSIAWGSSASLRNGDTVHTFGHPGGSSNVAWSEGTFRMRAERGGETFLISENYCRPGSSGGPLLDKEGLLVGVVTAVQRFQAKGGEPPQYGACISVTEATARALLSKPLFPIALAPAQYIPNY